MVFFNSEIGITIINRGPHSFYQRKLLKKAPPYLCFSTSETSHGACNTDNILQFCALELHFLLLLIVLSCFFPQMFVL